MADDWHVDPAALRAYADGTAGAAVAWSIETHLPVCSDCRRLVAPALAEPDTALLSELRGSLVLPTPRHMVSVRRSVLEGVLGPWWAWVTLVALAAGGLLLVGEMPISTFQQEQGLTWGLALSPLVPLVMVATIYAVADRDAASSATPRGGWELLLVRTAVVLGVACPVVAGALWMSGVGLVAWLLPGLGLCLGSLLLGSWVGVERASVGLAAVWALVVALAMNPGSILVTRLAPVINPAQGGVALWLVLITTTLAALLWRRERFEIPGGLR